MLNTRGHVIATFRGTRENELSRKVLISNSALRGFLVGLDRGFGTEQAVFSSLGVKGWFRGHRGGADQDGPAIQRRTGPLPRTSLPKARPQPWVPLKNGRGGCGGTRWDICGGDKWRRCHILSLKSTMTRKGLSRFIYE